MTVSLCLATVAWAARNFELCFLLSHRESNPSREGSTGTLYFWCEVRTDSGT